MAARFDLVTLDVPDPDRSATFWQLLLGLEIGEREDEGRWVCLHDDTGVRRVGLQRGAVRPGGIHLDLACAPDEFESELQRFQDLGAVLLAPVRHESYGSIANLRDPDGHVFDLCAYH